MSLALTITETVRVDGLAGEKKEVRGTMAFDSSYPTGGEALALSSLGLDSVASFNIFSDSGYVFKWDDTNKKVLAYTGGSQVSNATDLSALTAVPFIARGA